MRRDKLFRFSPRRNTFFLLSSCSLFKETREWGRLSFRSFVPQMKDIKPYVIASTHIQFGSLPFQAYGGKYFSLGSWQCNFSLHHSPFIFLFLSVVLFFLTDNPVFPFKYLGSSHLFFSVSASKYC